MKILLIEDDALFAQGLKSLLKDEGTIVHCRTAQEARQYLINTIPDIALIDLNLANENGLDLIRLLTCPKAVLSNSQNPEDIEKAYQLGADHFFTKRGYKKTVPEFIKNSLSEKAFENFILSKYITVHLPLITQLKLLASYPLQNKSLFITGPTGVGKSRLGKILHDYYHSEDAPFIHLNCSEITDSLIESELFGHEKGAFTGAHLKKEGKLKMANGGTLFLDEIGTMSMEMQRKLLKAIEEKSFYPVGSSNLEKVEFTLISASCENIEDKISKGTFREDLYYRLKSYTVHIPPLVDRPEDTEFLLQYFIDQSDRLILLKPEAKITLKLHTWPGNIRELKHLADQLVHYPKGIISNDDLRKLLLQKINPSQLQSSIGKLSEDEKDYILKVGLRQYFQNIEKEMAEHVLNKYQGKITNCIKALKISSSAFYRILENQ